MEVLIKKLKEVTFAVLPITLIVLALNFTVAPIEAPILIRFLIGAFIIIIGLTIFLLGIDIGVSSIGSLMGSAITKSNKVWIIGVAGLILGFFISIAEPDLQILANQVESVTSGIISKVNILIIVSLGIALFLTIGLLRIVFRFQFKIVLTIIYFIVFILAFFTSPEFLAISFDASGATTGAMTVPFMLALALGVSSLNKDGKASENDSFGLVGITSTGAILSVMIMSILSKTDKITGFLEKEEISSTSILGPFLKTIPVISVEIFFALLPLLIIFLVFQKKSFKLSKRAFFKIIKGLIYTFIGLILFLTGVNAGFMDVGTIMGLKIASLDNKIIVVVIGFILGLVTILAEPAVYVLTNQIEEVTSGYLKRKEVMFSLSIGVGVAVALTMIKIIIPEIQLWHYLLPGYLISIILSYIVPDLFIGIAFDSGGVASGPMTATFILAFSQGVAEAIDTADVLIDGFGIISMVALTPLIALQILGLIFKIKSKKEAKSADGN